MKSSSFWEDADGFTAHLKWWEHACFLQNIFSAVGESLPKLVFQPILKRKHVPGFLEEDVLYPKESLACLSHLVFVHHQAADTFPCVFR